MARGGFRPGAGRKKGTKDTKPRKGSKAHEDTEKIREILSYGIKAKAKLYHDYLTRINRGEKLPVADQKMVDKLAEELAANLIESERTGTVAECFEPLAYMLAVMNDPTADKERRDRMATAAAPYCHPRKGEGMGKKEEKEDRAKQAGKGRFRPSAPPLKRVK